MNADKHTRDGARRRSGLSSPSPAAGAAAPVRLPARERTDPLAIDTQPGTQPGTGSPPRGTNGQGGSRFEAPLPELTADERKQVERRVAISAFIVHETVREEGERELMRAPAALAWSGLAAGLSMGFSMLAQGLLRAYLPAAPWRPLVASLGYSVGFLIVVLGRQQLFTENTLTVILPLLAHPNPRTFGRVARLWALVLAANLLGALIVATVVARTSLFPPHVQVALAGVSSDSLRGGFGLTVLRAIFAGWLIALMVWLLPAAENARLHIIILLTYLVSLGGFSHIIAGAVEAFYLVNIGTITWGDFFVRFMLPTLIGNIIGGVSLVAALNYAQVVTESGGNAAGTTSGKSTGTSGTGGKTTSASR